ncbi:MAG: DUF4368 domain-containing protein [Solobacterium sp.]|nr:DUF4368 domain-containing protein [Solobacterium sp.]
MKQSKYNTALYMRLSRDDELQGESSSITTQRMMLRRYAEENNLTVYDEYVDDGYSGTNFDRPAFQRMLRDIEDGKVNCCLVKDLSRMGRNYLQVGLYTEVLFPEKGVRFIAINDGVDSLLGENEVAPIRNLINEWVARDTSKKVHAALQTKFLAGNRYGAYPPLGYRKDPDNKGHILIDEENRWIIEKIFDLAYHGYGSGRITKVLRAEKVPTGGYIHYKQDGTFAHIFDGAPEEKSYDWSTAEVKRILKDETYIGNSVHNKQTTVSFKNKKKYRTAEDTWLRIENTHEAIISHEVFERVQEQIKSRRRETKTHNSQIFAGLLKCADCGWGLSYKFHSKPDYHYYVCSRYAQLGKDVCSSHSVRYDDLYDYVLSRIQYWSRQAEIDPKKLLGHLLASGDRQRESLLKKHTSEMKKAEKRKAELDRLFTQLYEDRVEGKISEYNYSMLSTKYQDEQKSLEEKLISLQKEIDEKKQSADNAQAWIELIRKYAYPTELTAELLNTLIEKIVVHQANTDNGYREQEIEIYYRFVGKID